MTPYLGELVDIKGGGTPDRKDARYWGGNVPWATVKDFKSTELAETQETITELGVENSATNVIPAGTIIVPTRMAVGKAAVTAVDMAINQDLKALIIKDRKSVDQQYLLRFLLAKAQVLEGMSKGATVKGITLDVLRELEVFLPPLKEQKRIAAILDKADAIRGKRQQAIQLADEFLRSVFLDMFGNPVTNPKGWETSQLSDYLEFLTSGSRGWAKYYSESGSKFIRIQNVAKNALLLEDMAYVNAPDGAEARRTKVRTGDVLLSITADLGRSAVVTEQIDGAHINQHLALLRLTKNVLNPRYLSAFLSSEGGVRQFLAKNKSAVKSGLNFTDIRTLTIPVPPIKLQDRYERLYEKVLHARVMAVEARNVVDTLCGSLSQKAFAGEL